MRIEKDNPGFLKALNVYFPRSNVKRCVCAIDDNDVVLGGCGFSNVVNGVTYGFLLGLQRGWASREIYAAIMRYPFETLEADLAVAIVGKNKRSFNCCLKLGGVPNEDGTRLTFSKERTYKIAQQLEEVC